MLIKDSMSLKAFLYYIFDFSRRGRKESGEAQVDLHAERSVHVPAHGRGVGVAHVLGLGDLARVVESVTVVVPGVTSLHRALVALNETEGKLTKRHIAWCTESVLLKSVASAECSTCFILKRLAMVRSGFAHVYS